LQRPKLLWRVNPTNIKKLQETGQNAYKVQTNIMQLIDIKLLEAAAQAAVEG
jgi:hypothetical protein